MLRPEGDPRLSSQYNYVQHEILNYMYRATGSLSNSKSIIII